MKLAEALLRRKELQQKVEQLHKLKADDQFQIVYKRTKIGEDVDDLQARVPRMTASQVTEEYDFYANRLRLIDAAIQQCNWTAEVSVDAKVWDDYTPKTKQVVQVQV